MRTPCDERTPTGSVGTRAPRRTGDQASGDRVGAVADLKRDRTIGRTGKTPQVPSDPCRHAGVPATATPQGAPAESPRTTPQCDCCSLGAAAPRGRRVRLPRRTNELADQRPLSQRRPGCRAWAEGATGGLETGRAENPILRALLHTVAARNFPTTGFAPTYKAPSRSWTSPASPPRRTSNATSTTLLNRTGAGRGPATSRWPRHGLPPSSRHLTEALQRLDHLTDLADDLVQGRLYLPQHDLDHCDASRVALQQGDDIPATRALITLTCQKTRKALTAAHALLNATAPRFQPLRRALQLVRDVNDTPTGEARNGFVPERLSRSAAWPPSCGPGWLVPAARALPRAPSDGTGADAVPQRVPPSLPSRRAAGRLSPPRSRQPAAPSNSRL